MAGFDLHVHSSASDGAETPAALVKMAKERGLLGLAITDHDTAAGLKEATEQALLLNFPFIPGIEISSELHEKDVHILGYWLDLPAVSADVRLQKMQEARSQRCYEMVERLNLLGMELSAEEIIAEAGNCGSLGRPHVAMAMVKAGYCTSIKEAFNKWLGRGMPGYVPRLKLDPWQAIEIVLSAGGVPVLAHPGKGVPDQLIPRLIKAGLGGIEIYHPDHNYAAVRKYLRIAQRYRIAATGGSDFHIQGVRDLGCRITTVNQLARLAEKREDILGKRSISVEEPRVDDNIR